MTRIEVLVLEGASPSAVALTLELIDTANQLQRAAAASPPFSISLSGSGAAMAQAMLGEPVAMARSEPPDILVTPCLQLRPELAGLVRFNGDDATEARARVADAAAQGAELAASGNAVFLLASAGVLDGRRATAPPWLVAGLRDAFPAVRLEPEAAVVNDGGRLTASAPLAQLDLMLALVARHAGPDLAARCARQLLLDGQLSRARYMAAGFLAGGDERIARVERWALGRLEQSFPVEALADAAGMSPRTFARRLRRATGLSPVRFVQRLRVRSAVDMLKTTQLPLDEIARRVGYAEPSTLRRLLRRDGAPGARETRRAMRPPGLPTQGGVGGTGGG